MPTPIPIACSLEQVALSERRSVMAELGQSLSAVTAEGREARLRFPVEHGPEVVALVAAESSCCPFFAFGQVRRDGEIELVIRAPEGAEEAVRSLVAALVAGWGERV